MTKLSKEAMREYMRRRRSADPRSTHQITKTDTGVRIDPPKKVDQKIWDEACKRAERAKRYAEKFPSFIGSGEEIFQTVEWQYAREIRYQRKEQSER